jgi:anti-sigma regulatory factor (Ser/Thr protein kinase)
VGDLAGASSGRAGSRPGGATIILGADGEGWGICVVRRRGSSTATPRRCVAVADCLAGWGVDDDDVAWGRVADVLLAAGEILANAARWCEGPIGLMVEAHRCELRVEVSDDHPGAAIMEHADPLAEGGRGLSLVDAVVDQWGQTGAGKGPGKMVWFSVEVAEGSALGRDCQQTGP